MKNKYLQKFKNLILLLLVFISLTLALPTFADDTSSATDFDQLFSLPEINAGIQLPTPEVAEIFTTSPINGISDKNELFLTIVNFILGFVGIVSMTMIIVGGFFYITAAGEEAGAEKGKKIISYAVIGMLIIIASYTIVSTVLRLYSPL